MKILVVGGCGFIGCNVARRMRESGHEVTVLDNLSRSGTDRNLAWLRRESEVGFLRGDLRDAAAVTETVREGRYDVIVHLAGQVAVTTSVADPRTDFDVNALGAFNLLEAVRLASPESIVLNASTNKVYGDLSGLPLEERETRYLLPGLPDGVPETQPLDFHSPYGCSKGAAEQYVLDYARTYGLRTANFRQSCIYGPRQFGIEDQGWVAWFTIAHLLERPLTVYGTGKQVRDALHVEDLVDAYVAAIERIDGVAGASFNIGGGPANTLSLLELIAILEELSGRPVRYAFAAARPGDQAVYVSDVRRAATLLDWSPKIEVRAGVEALYEWVESNLDDLEDAVRAREA